MPLVLMAIAVAAALALPAAAEVLDESIPADPEGTVEIELDFGEGLRLDPGFLAIDTHGASEVRLQIETSGWGTWGVESSLGSASDTVTVSVLVGGTTTWMFGGPNVRVHVWVPESSRVEARCRGGALRVADVEGPVRARVRDADVEIRGVQGPVRLRVVGGAVDVEDVAGAVEIASTDGEIRAARVGGGVEARTSEGAIALQHVSGGVTAKTLSGDIELSHVEGPAVARTENGSVEAHFTAAAAGSLETERGSVLVTLPDAAGATVDARATRGEIEFSPGLGWRGEADAHQATGTVGAGGPRLSLRTSRGEIRVSGR
jgi:hypothetical protein